MLCLQKFTTSNGEVVSDLRGAQCVRYVMRLAIVASAEVLAFCEYRLLLCEVEELLPGCLLGREEVERKTFASPATQLDHWGLTATIKSPHAKKTQRKTQRKPFGWQCHDKFNYNNEMRVCAHLATVSGSAAR